jgi:hypothetical protein
MVNLIEPSKEKRNNVESAVGMELTLVPSPSILGIYPGGCDHLIVNVRDYILLDVCNVMRSL